MSEEQKPVDCISAEQLSKMSQPLDGLDKSSGGYQWRKGWNDALRQAMDYCRPVSPHAVTNEQLIEHVRQFMAFYGLEEKK